jgi:radical SAM superfamily enzyme YgiQ (UPF0313 family)
MPDILLTHGYFLYEDEKEQQIMKPYPTLGLLYLSSYLKRAGFSVEVFDTTLAQRQDLVTRLRTGPAGVLGIYTNLITRASVLRIIREAVSCGWTVVLGGPEAANYPEEYLRRGAHVVVAGEGEETLAELIPALRDRGAHRLHDVLGVCFLNEDGVMVANPRRPEIPDIDALPWPDREQVDIPAYMQIWKDHHGMGSVNLITARGCPYRCKWCSHAVFGYTHRRRSFMDCVNEVEAIRDVYQPDQLWYADDVFTINHAWLYHYGQELKRRGIRIPFETITRADRMLKDEVAATLAEMGCYRIWIGSESGSQRILDSMQRGVTTEQVQVASRLAQKHGIQVGMFLMWGYEGETEEDIAATVEHVKTVNPDIFFTTVAYPIKNTPYFQDVADRAVLDTDWEEVTDRDYKLRGRHSRRYYKFADRWLRSEVEAERLRLHDASGADVRLAEAREARRELAAAAGEVEV